MANTPCLVRDIILITVSGGSKYHGGIDMDGNELTDVQVVTDFNIRDQRTYKCKNCGKVWDGSESFEPIKEHFGTFPID